jgi:hypothetical protein
LNKAIRASSGPRNCSTVKARNAGALVRVALGKQVQAFEEGFLGLDVVALGLFGRRQLVPLDGVRCLACQCILEDLPVAALLLLHHLRSRVSGVQDQEIGVFDGHAGSRQRRIDLLVHRTDKAQARMVGEHAQLREEAPAVVHFQAVLDQEPVGLGRALLRELHDPGDGFRRHLVVGVEPHDPSAGGVVDAHVAGRGEVAAPGPVHHLGTGLLAKFHRAVGGAGIHHDQLAGKVLDRCEECRKVALLVLDDHAEGKIGSGHQNLQPHSR